jgi:hypothetical protein
MAIKQVDLNEPKRRKTHKGWYKLRRPQNGPAATRQYTAQDVHHLAHSRKRVAGVIRPDTGDLRLSVDLVGRDGQQTNPPPRVIVVIVALALVFITIITYFVSQMPPKT